MWVGTLCRHAAVLAHAMGDVSREIQYADRRYLTRTITVSRFITLHSCCCVMGKLVSRNATQQRHVNWLSTEE